MAEVKYWVPGTLADVEELLRQDGNGRLEGTVSENLMTERLVRPLVGEVSAPFWFATAWGNDTYHAFYLHRAGEVVVPAAREFINRLNARPDIGLHVVEYSYEDDKLDFRITESATYQGMALQRSVRAMADQDFAAARARQQSDERRKVDPKYRKHFPPRFLRVPRQPGWMPNATVPEREDKALSYLREHLDLRDVLAERIFVNQILYRYYLYFWDLDGVGFVNGELIGFELKRKYPAQNGTFGLNSGTGRLFKNLSSSLPVLYLIMASGTFEGNEAKGSPLEVIENQSVSLRIFGKWLTPETLAETAAVTMVKPSSVGIAVKTKEVPMYENFTYLGDYDSPELVDNLRAQVASRFSEGQLSAHEVLKLMRATPSS